MTDVYKHFEVCKVIAVGDRLLATMPVLFDRHQVAYHPLPQLYKLQNV